MFGLPSQSLAWGNDPYGASAATIPPCNASKNSLKLPHCVVTRFHSCCNCTLHAASINFTDLCVPSNNPSQHRSFIHSHSFQVTLFANHRSDTEVLARRLIGTCARLKTLQQVPGSCACPQGLWRAHHGIPSIYFGTKTEEQWSSVKRPPSWP